MSAGNTTVDATNANVDEVKPLTSAEDLAAGAAQGVDRASDSDSVSFSDHEASFDDDQLTRSPSKSTITNADTKRSTVTIQKLVSIKSPDSRSTRPSLSSTKHTIAATSHVNHCYVPSNTERARAEQTPKKRRLSAVRSKPQPSVWRSDSFRKAYNWHRQSTSEYYENWSKQSLQDKCRCSKVNCGIFVSALTVFLILASHIASIVAGELMHELWRDNKHFSETSVNAACQGKYKSFIDDSNEAFEHPSDVFRQIMIVGCVQTASLCVVILFSSLVDAEGASESADKKESGFNVCSFVVRVVALVSGSIYMCSVVWGWVVNGYYIDYFAIVMDHCHEKSKVYEEMEDIGVWYMPFVAYAYLVAVLLCAGCCCAFAKGAK